MKFLVDLMPEILLKSCYVWSISAQHIHFLTSRCTTIYFDITIHLMSIICMDKKEHPANSTSSVRLSTASKMTSINFLTLKVSALPHPLCNKFSRKSQTFTGTSPVILLYKHLRYFGSITSSI